MVIVLSNLTILKTDNTGIINSDNTSTIKTDTPTYKEKNKNISKDSVCVHTRQQPKIKISDILEIAEQLGYAWSEQEAQAFLDYNLDRGRKSGWEFAVKKWEENRKSRCARRRGRRRERPEMTPQEIAEMNEYLSLVNQFTEDEL